jgi:hypothetical protein
MMNEQKRKLLVIILLNFFSFYSLKQAVKKLQEIATQKNPFNTRSTGSRRQDRNRNDHNVGRRLEQSLEEV